MRSRFVASAFISCAIPVMCISALTITEGQAYAQWVTLSLLRTDNADVVGAGRTKVEVPNEDPVIEYVVDLGQTHSVADSVVSVGNVNGPYAEAFFRGAARINTVPNAENNIGSTDAIVYSQLDIYDPEYEDSYAGTQHHPLYPVASASGDFEPQDVDFSKPVYFDDGGVTVVVSGGGTNSVSLTFVDAYVEPHRLSAYTDGSGEYILMYDDLSDSLPAVEIASGSGINVTFALDGLEWWDVDGDGTINTYSSIPFDHYDETPIPGESGGYGTHQYTYKAHTWFEVVQEE